MKIELKLVSDTIYKLLQYGYLCKTHGNLVLIDYYNLVINVVHSEIVWKSVGYII